MSAEIVDRLLSRFRIAADGVQRRYGQSAPGRAQHREPRDAIRRMQQRAEQRKQIENFRPIAQQVNLDAAKGNLLLSQSAR